MGYHRKNRKDGAASVRRQTDTKGYRSHAFRCEKHGKHTWLDRKIAKQVIRSMRWGGADVSGMREYRCDVYEGGWHVGHMPPAVIEGKRTASEQRARREKRNAS